MKPRDFGGSFWLLLFGAASILLIGAFTRFDNIVQTVSPGATTPATEAASGAAPVPEPAPYSGPATVAKLPSDLSPGLADIIRMAQAKIPEDTIVAYVENSGTVYSLTADEIVYLTDIGVSDRVLTALLKRPEAPAAPTVASAPMPPTPPTPTEMPTPALPPAPAAFPAPATTPLADGMLEVPPPAAVVQQPPPLQNPQESYFYNSLAPYGDWVQTGDGWGWQPMVASVNPNWMPYGDRGQWLFTDNGWYWQSDYSWGWAPFHYGRWRHHDHLGWVWIPGQDWAPAWVAWRNSDDGYAGWAPLPPGVLFDPAFGLITVSGMGGLEASYGLNAALFMFVPQRSFLEHNPGRFAAGHADRQRLFSHSTATRNYSVSGGKIVNLGVSQAQIAAAAKTTVPKVTLREASSPEAAGAGRSGRSVAVFRPDPAALRAVPASTFRAAKAPILINQTPRRTVAETAKPALPSTPTAAMSRSAAAPGSGFISGNLQPPASRTATVTGTAPLPPERTPRVTDARNLALPSTPAPQPGYPAYSPRSGSPSLPAAQGRADFNYSFPRNAPSFSQPLSPTPRETLAGGRSSIETAPRNPTGPSQPRVEPQHNAPSAAPAENRGGNGQTSQGNGSSGSNNSPGNSNKSGK